LRIERPLDLGPLPGGLSVYGLAKLPVTPVVVAVMVPQQSMKFPCCRQPDGPAPVTRPNPQIP
jgi:hypothetical protein